MAKQASSPATEKALQLALLRSGRPANNVFETVVERLGQSIKLGLFKAGQQLPPERELAVLAGVSRVTIRAALQVLIEGGFLHARRGRNGGTFVVDHPPLWPKRDKSRKPQNGVAAYELLDKRLVVGAGVAALAARRISKMQVAALRQLIGRLDAAVGNLRAFRTIDAQFHIAIAEATGNESLTRLTAEIEAGLADLIHMIPRSEEALRHSNEQHRFIVGRLAMGDAAGARDAMAEHLEGTYRLLSGLLPKAAGKNPR